MQVGFLADSDAKYRLTAVASRCGVSLRFEKLGGLLFKKYALHITGTDEARSEFERQIRAGRL